MSSEVEPDWYVADFKVSITQSQVKSSQYPRLSTQLDSILFFHWRIENPWHLAVAGRTGFKLLLQSHFAQEWRRWWPTFFRIQVQGLWWVPICQPSCGEATCTCFALIRINVTLKNVNCYHRPGWPGPGAWGGSIKNRYRADRGVVAFLPLDDASSGFFGLCHQYMPSIEVRGTRSSWI